MSGRSSRSKLAKEKGKKAIGGNEKLDSSQTSQKIKAGRGSATSHLDASTMKESGHDQVQHTPRDQTHDCVEKKGKVRGRKKGNAFNADSVMIKVHTNNKRLDVADKSNTAPSSGKSMKRSVDQKERNRNEDASLAAVGKLVGEKDIDCSAGIQLPIATPMNLPAKKRKSANGQEKKSENIIINGTSTTISTKGM